MSVSSVFSKSTIILLLINFHFFVSADTGSVNGSSAAIPAIGDSLTSSPPPQTEEEDQVKGSTASQEETSDDVSVNNTLDIRINSIFITVSEEEVILPNSKNITILMNDDSTLSASHDSNNILIEDNGASGVSSIRTGGRLYSSMSTTSMANTELLQSSEAAAVLAIIFIALAIVAYSALVLWRHILDKRYGNRELLINEDYYDVNDLKYFEL